MSEPGSLYRLSVLEERWASDRSPRVFLQYADELRRADRTGHAIEVLRDGVAEHPESVSGWVALGRVLLDEGDSRAAIAALEQAIERDPAQLVANRLLTEAWIRVGDSERARASLERSRLLSLPDGDFAALDEEIRTLETGGGSAGAALRPTPREGGTQRPFDLPSPGGLPEIDLGNVTPIRRGWVPVDVGGEPFSELLGAALPRSAELNRRLREGGIFDPGDRATVAAAEEPAAQPVALLSTPAPVAAAEASAEALPEDSVSMPGEGEAATPPSEAVFEPLSIGAEVERETLEPEPELPETFGAPAATSTLGALYLAQGHLDEAEAEYRRVLVARPDDEEAIAGIAAIAERRRETDSAPASPPLPVGLTARKLLILRRIYDHLRARRREGQAGVS